MHSRCAPLPSSFDARRVKRVVGAIAFAFSDGAWSPALMARRAAHDLGLHDDDWLHELAGQVSLFPDSPTDRPRRFEMFVEEKLLQLADRGETSQIRPWLERRHIEEGWQGPPTLQHNASMANVRWPVVPLTNPGELANALNLDPASLLWFVDLRSLERTAADENLRHYDYHWIAKASGGHRLVEAPKQNLKAMQRWILREILNHIPAHDAAHGFRRARSIQSFAAPHTGRDWVARLDLRNFFTSVPHGRIRGIFAAAGYPTPVAQMLTGLCTNATPPAILSGRSDDTELVAQLRGPHLPQGAPTSPALANLSAFSLDTRLHALAERFDARYTRYADDLAFSGHQQSRDELDRLITLANDIVVDEGFALRRSKTRIRRSHQRQVLTGMVVNSHLNLHRRDLDRLRAEVHEAATKGPKAANRRAHAQYRAHLEGKIGFVQSTNPTQARRLWAAFDKIDWSS